MNKLFVIPLLIISFAGSSLLAHAQMRGGQFVSEEIYEHTIKEEAEGRALWETLNAGEVTCAELASEDYDVLGEYFMGQMMGEAHPAMNAMMIQMMGEEGEEQVHEVMGRRLSGCDTTAAFPSGGICWMPMMQMMWGGLPTGQAGWSSPFGFFGWIVWRALIVIAVVALIRWIANRFGGGVGEKTALDILKERYVRGEIDKKEFEERKKSIT